MKRFLWIALVAGCVLAAASLALLRGSTVAVGGGDNNTLERVANGELKAPTLVTKDSKGNSVTRRLPFVSGSLINAQLLALCEKRGVTSCDDRLAAGDATSSGNLTLDGSGSTGGPHTLGCGERNDAHVNVRVNQDCTYRRQAEEDITYNPTDPSNIVAGQNDSRIGFNHCGIDFSVNDGKNWGDMLPPFWQHLNSPELDGPNTLTGSPGTFHTYDAASDPANAVDSSGHAYFTCVVFDIASNANGVLATESPEGAKGSFYYNVPISERHFVVDEENSPNALTDKEWIAADRYASSPNRDDVYVTWTVFRFSPSCAGGTDEAPAFCNSPIYGSVSTDHGHTWSAPQVISGTAPGLCFFGNGFDPSAPESACDFDQGSNPVVMPDGTLLVVFNNGNTPAGDANAQQLAVRCTPSGDSSAGTAKLSCERPVKVGDDILVGEPLCDFGRGPEECVPGAYIRTNDFPRITTENTQNNHVYVTWQDYRNGEYDIQLAESTDGGKTWGQLGQVNPDTGLDHYFPATDQSPSQGDAVGVSYYRTARVPDENTTPEAGFAPCGENGVVNMGASTTCQPGVGAESSDYVLAGGTGLASITASGDNTGGPGDKKPGDKKPGDKKRHDKRIGSEALPTPFAYQVISPVFPPPDGIQSGFNGDYSGLTINTGTEAHPIWSDTRNADPYPANGVAHDEDVFSDAIPLPSGKAATGTGSIGH
ncbi:MAG TPA: hypothetical protein VE982_05065 [Gaiellaceae bacterium]|nr:hypothetical protein [Gaiellaceae bacterium]